MWNLTIYKHENVLKHCIFTFSMWLLYIPLGAIAP